ncbi:MAG: hypothetical protein L6408_07795, partial [Nanoarchaeota archaeon]|nr:hypothetical protein [Nanoarchaeota archaeon]
EEVQIANAIVNYATESLKEDNFRHTLYYLESFTGTEHKSFTEPLEFEEIGEMAVKASEYCVDRVKEDPGYAILKPKLYELLNELEKEQKKEFGRDTMEIILKDIEVILGKSTAYALWTYYNLEMNRNDTLQEAHQDIRDHFASADNTKYGRFMGFKAILQSDEDFDTDINFLLDRVEEIVLKKEEYGTSSDNAT